LPFTILKDCIQHWGMSVQWNMKGNGTQPIKGMLHNGG